MAHTAWSADLWPVLPVGAGIAERSEARPHTSGEPTGPLTSPWRGALPGDAGQRSAPRCRRHTP